MRKLLLLFAGTLLLTGCVPVDSLNPLYTDKDIVFDESLLGTWVGPDNGKECACATNIIFTLEYFLYRVCQITA